MANIGADSKTRIAIFHERENVVRVPKFVIWFGGALWVAMDPCGDVVFLNEFIDEIDLIGGGLDGDGSHAEFFRELKDAARPGLIAGNSHHAQIYDQQAVLFR